MTLRQFAYLGIFDASYIKPETIDGNTQYAVHAADGSLLFRVADREAARVLSREFRFVPQPVH
ncbi:MAG TPA: hypothetical protein VK196_16810 [Magnetospirillum sp.]|nr:hypothetical protein [Magnetospirillum sp.]